MINAKRSFNSTFNLIEYHVDGTKKPIFQTCEREKGKVVFQLVKKILLRCIKQKVNKIYFKLIFA
jgi:hypothetical protein